MKNVIFIHMESLNQAIFSHRHWFPCLNTLYPRALRLNNFISSATSSLMAMGDLLHGNDDVMEHNQDLEQGITINRLTPSLFDQLKSQGYRTAGMGYPKSWGNVDNIWSEDQHQPFNWYDSPAQMLAQAEALIADNTQPFALYCWNLSSHLCYADAIKASGKHSFERWQRGYQSLDATVGALLRLLLKYKQMDNTVIVGFGDHGDDFWNHGYHGGFAHAMEPYTALIHTPAFIFDARYQGAEINHLVSMVDIKQSVLAMLGLESKAIPPTTFPLLSGQRQYCFSRNLFLNQRGQANGSPLKKGYAVTSDYFHLLQIDGKDHLFAWQADSGNHFDLLRLLATDAAGEPCIDLTQLGVGRAGGAHPHVRHFLGAEGAAVIAENYREMSQALQQWLQRKQAVVKALV